MKNEDLKHLVKEKYGAIAAVDTQTGSASCCCGSGCCGEAPYASFNDNYSGPEGYNPEADLNLGCGLPTEFAGIREGDRVLDLGSGAGNDCFVARSQTGAKGRVTGLDMTEAMVQKARENLAKTGFDNIDFVAGDIEDMPFPDHAFDVVISNCVLNLVPEKARAFREIFRVLKPGGHFCISDVVLQGELPAALKEAAEMYAGCVSGAMQKREYLDFIEGSGFSDIVLHKSKPIILPEDLLLKYLSDKEVHDLLEGKSGIYSITVGASK